MLDAAREAIAFTAGKGDDDLKTDRVLSLACVRLLEVVGEAASQVSQDFRRHHPEVPWAQIAGMRNRLIHAYFDVDQDVLWETLSGDLPALVTVLEEVLQEEGE
jgi:uncharacterized protein with HEPN domain